MRSVSLFPGLRLNFSKSGVSTTVGPRGASVTFRPQAAHADVRIPRGSSTSQPQPTYETDEAQEIGSASVEVVTQSRLADFTRACEKALSVHARVTPAYGAAHEGLSTARNAHTRITNSVLEKMFFFWRLPGLRKQVTRLEEETQRLGQQLASAVVSFDFQQDPSLAHLDLTLVRAFGQVARASRIWDVTSQRGISTQERSAASRRVGRTPVTFQVANIPAFNCKRPAVWLRNANGADLYMYPGVLLLLSGTGRVGAILATDLEITYGDSQFVEREQVPADSRVVGKAWAKSNVDGSRDKRFADNYEIPIALYGRVSLASGTGLNEEYMISNASAARSFVDAFVAYRVALMNSLSETRAGPTDETETQRSDGAPTSRAFSEATLVALAQALSYVARADGRFAASEKKLAQARIRSVAEAARVDGVPALGVLDGKPVSHVQFAEALKLLAKAPPGAREEVIGAARELAGVSSGVKPAEAHVLTKLEAALGG